MIFETNGDIEIRRGRATNSVEIDLHIDEIVEQIGVNDILNSIGRDKAIEYFEIKEAEE